MKSLISQETAEASNNWVKMDFWLTWWVMRIFVFDCFGNLYCLRLLWMIKRRRRQWKPQIWLACWSKCYWNNRQHCVSEASCDFKYLLSNANFENTIPIERLGLVSLWFPFSQRGPRYFDPPDSGWGACFNCGDEGHTVENCTTAKRKKPCFVCGSLEHNAKQCSKVRWMNIEFILLFIVGLISCATNCCYIYPKLYICSAHTYM